MNLLRNYGRRYDKCQQIVNTILDDILANTYAFLQLKPYLPSWRQHDELFDLGVIDRESHQQVINKLKEKWFSFISHKKIDGKGKLGCIGTD
jgi:hypothetical protein